MFCSKNSENVLKGIDPSKITKRQFLEAELSQNPEFFKAFPHLKPIAKKVLDETYDEKLDVYDQKYANIQAKKYELIFIIASLLFIIKGFEFNLFLNFIRKI